MPRPARRGAATGGSAADVFGERGRTGRAHLVLRIHLDEDDPTVAAPPQMGHRTYGYDDDRRRPEHELHRRDDLGGERRDGGVREDRKLTTVTLVQVVRPERDGDGGD